MSKNFGRELLLASMGLEEVTKIEERGKGQFAIAKADVEKQLVYGVVLEPMTDVTDIGDAHGDRMTEKEIEKSAHGYMKDHQNIKLQHQGGNVKANPVESYIAPCDMTIGEQEIKKGSWVLVTKINHDGLWKAIKKGLIGGYSPGGTGFRVSYDEN